ncbi:MAG: DUF1566 domain-containing protein [Ignavibacteriales bacterium]|nr:DUF1566 domain-containing protein [Ignavibacteriales bacterium]
MFIRYIIAASMGIFFGSAGVGQTYKIVDAGQAKCFDSIKVIAPPSPGKPFYGQDAQYSGNLSSYTIGADGKTVYDNTANLTWMRSPNMTYTPPVKTDRMSYAAGLRWVTAVNASNHGGFNDWRIPTIKELYSLYSGKGTDPGGSASSAGLTPYIDSSYFKFAYGNTALGERVIDQQYMSGNIFIMSPSESGYAKDFGVNFADGRIKGYDTVDALAHQIKTFYVQLVRGATTYGINNFTDNGDQTITDNAAGLMWAKNDNGSGLCWIDALAWVQTKNAENYLGHNDWRMPDIKELQSIVDYSHSPDFDKLPAINSKFFNCSPIINEAGQPDFPYYWSGTTHEGYATNNTGGGEADYIAFGRALGWPTTQASWVDVHGAGCQRSDPKVGPPYAYADVKTVTVYGVSYTGYSHGPQGDAIRGANYVRIVRTVNKASGFHNGPTSPSHFELEQNFPNPFNPTTIIRFTVPLTGKTMLRVFNSLGQRVAILYDGIADAAIDHQVQFSASYLPSGIYFSRLEHDGKVQSKKMQLLK